MSPPQAMAGPSASTSGRQQQQQARRQAGLRPTLGHATAPRTRVAAPGQPSTSPARLPPRPPTRLPAAIGGGGGGQVSPHRPGGRPPRQPTRLVRPTLAPSSKGGGGGGDKEKKNKAAARAGSWTVRERWVVAGLVAGLVVVGPRLALLGAVALERAAVGAALSVEAALSTAFLSAFSLLAAGAGVALAGAAVYFFVLEEGRLGAGQATEDEDGDEEE